MTAAPPLCPHRTYAYVRAYGNICRGRVALLASRPPARPCSSPFASRRQGGEALPHPPDYRALIPRTVERRYPVLLRADTLGYPRALVRAAPRRRSLSASLATLSGHDAAPFRSGGLRHAGGARQGADAEPWLTRQGNAHALTWRFWRRQLEDGGPLRRRRFALALRSMPACGRSWAGRGLGRGVWEMLRLCGRWGRCQQARKGLPRHGLAG